MTQEILYDENRNIIEPSYNIQEATKVVDAYWTELVHWDNIISIKPLPVKNWDNINKGEKFSKIRLTDDPEVVLAKHPKNGEMYLRTEYFKKA